MPIEPIKSPTMKNRPTLTRRHLLACAPALLAWPAAPVLAHGSEGDHRTSADTPQEQTAWGIAGEPRLVRRTLQVTMHDSMRFEPARIAVKLDETLRLRVRNAGAVMHEFVIGTPDENRRHAELMMKFPDMQHDEPWMAHVPPGRTGELVWHFNRPGTFEFACLIAGHYQAGMTGLLTVGA